jgi:hypothetical protein
MIAKQSKYLHISNNYIVTKDMVVGHNYPSQKVFGCETVLPDWFVYWSGKKFIKFYGSSIIRNRVNFVNRGIMQENPEDEQMKEIINDEDIFEYVLNMSIHSEITRFSNEGYTIKDIDRGDDPLNRERDLSTFEPCLKKLKVTFYNNTGAEEPVFYLLRGSSTNNADPIPMRYHEVDMSNLIFDIECELIVSSIDF